MISQILERGLIGSAWGLLVLSSMMVNPVIGFTLGVVLITRYCILVYQEYQTRKVLEQLLEVITEHEEEAKKERQRLDQ